MGSRKRIVPAAHRSVCAGSRAAGSVGLGPERELTTARIRSERQAEVKAEPGAASHTVPLPAECSRASGSTAMEPLSFQEYICSLDTATLPRILRICSGVYFQGECWVPAASKGCPKAVPPPPAMPLQPGVPPPALKMAGPLPQGCPCPGRGTGPHATTRHWCLGHSFLQKSFSSTPSAHPAECPSAFSHSTRKVVGHQKPSKLVLHFMHSSCPRR